MRLNRRRTRLSAALMGVGLSLALVAPAGGAMTTPRFAGPAEPLATYVPQSSCSPTAKPGVVRFSQAVMKAYPGTGTYGIVRACGQGGRSEHKEGRAWDWKVDADVPAQRAAAHDLMRWLFATDAKGVRAANARRVGLMYLIFDRKIWSAYAGGTGWRAYSGANPHTDHMHLSFSWSGARAQTSWFAATAVPARKAIPTPPRTAPLPAPRPLPKVPIAQPEHDDDHEGGWRPGRGRPGDDAASRAAKAVAKAQRAAERAQARAARQRAEQQRRAAEEQVRAARLAQQREQARAALAAAREQVAAAAAAEQAARHAHAAAQQAETAQEQVREQLREALRATRARTPERAAAEEALRAAEVELARLRAAEDAAEGVLRQAARGLGEALKRSGRAEAVAVELGLLPGGDAGERED